MFRLEYAVIIAHLVVVFGNAVNALHLPDEIRDAVMQKHQEA